MKEKQQQPPLHSAVVDGLAHLADPRYRENRHSLYVDGFGVWYRKPPIDRRSLQHLVDFLDNHVDSHADVVITDLILDNVTLVSGPSPDGGLNVLKDFFTRSDISLTKVTLRRCDFGTTEDAVELLAAFHTNRTITDLGINCGVANLEGSAFGNSLSGLMQNMPQLQRLNCYGNHLRAEGVLAFQPALRANRTLKQLDLGGCLLEDGGLCFVADALVSNTTMELLNLQDNYFTSAGLVEITCMIESAHLKTINFPWNLAKFNDNAIQHFATAIVHKNSALQQLTRLNCHKFPGATLARIQNSLMRNQQLNRVTSLLSVPPPPPAAAALQRQPHATSSMMLKITHHQAIAKLTSTVGDCSNAVGASAIFKLQLQARPALLGKRIKQPASAAADAADAAAVSANVASIRRSLDGSVATTPTFMHLAGQKRPWCACSWSLYYKCIRCILNSTLVTFVSTPSATAPAPHTPIACGDHVGEHMAVAAALAAAPAAAPENGPE
jgi:hypothetical protein